MFAIKEMREKAGYKQQDVADKLDVTIRRYSNWEREDREINLRDAIRLADLFECSLDELAGREWHGSEAPPLSGAEHEIVDAYRACDQSGQEAIQAAVCGIAQRFDKSDSENMAERGA